MTDEEIKQAAANYYEHTITDDEKYKYSCECYCHGAHSRNEEIKELEWEKKHYQDIAWQLAAENEQLRNPWRDAKKEPPEEYKNRRSKPVLIRYGIDYTHYDVWRYNYEKHYWENMSIYPMTEPDYWMPIPTIPKSKLEE